MLLGAAKYLAETRGDGTAVLIFQPAEGGGGGGREMCADGMMDRWGIQEVYGMHNMPHPGRAFRHSSGACQRRISSEIPAATLFSRLEDQRIDIYQKFHVSAVLPPPKAPSNMAIMAANTSARH